MDQVTNNTADRAPWLAPYRYRKGESRHSRAGARLNAKITGLTDQFVAAYQRQPHASELLLIHNIAENALKKRRTATDQNTLDRLLRRLFKPAPREPSPSSPPVPMPSLESGK